MTRVMCFGTFDKLHPGHLYYFQEAKKLGDYLIVVVARDVNVRKLKGHLPTNGEKDRQRKIKELDWIDEVRLGKKRNRWRVISRGKPDIIVLGYDQLVDEAKLKRKFRGKIVRLDAFQPDKYKSSKIK